ncbi:uncharacterized protein RBU33_013463 [Hipposideros larvatus]
MCPGRGARPRRAWGRRTRASAAAASGALALAPRVRTQPAGGRLSLVPQGPPGSQPEPCTRGRRRPGPERRLCLLLTRPVVLSRPTRISETVPLLLPGGVDSDGRLGESPVQDREEERQVLLSLGLGALGPAFMCHRRQDVRARQMTLRILMKNGLRRRKMAPAR